MCPCCCVLWCAGGQGSAQRRGEAATGVCTGTRPAVHCHYAAGHVTSAAQCSHQLPGKALRLSVHTCLPQQHIQTSPNAHGSGMAAHQCATSDGILAEALQFEASTESNRLAHDAAPASVPTILAVCCCCRVCCGDCAPTSAWTHCKPQSAPCCLAG